MARPRFGLPSDLSAARLAPSRSQAFLGGGLLLALLALAAFNPLLALQIMAGLGVGFFVIFPTFRFLLAWQVLGEDSSLSPPRDQLRASAGSALPVYTVIVALYQENARTVNALLGALGELDYPQEKLDVLLLLERDDPETWAAIDGARGRPWLRVVEVPPGSPRTKPRALNYGLAAARGEFVAVYDAEDRPEPDQLRKAVWALRRFPRVACVQARLAYYNPRQNLLTRWFTLEYQAWFRLTLPGLHKLNSALPLGGTSNHFKADVLRDCGAWDPYNVTEDADLGIRLMRHGHDVRMLDSTTFEEAVSRIRPWIRQRTRWIKGYMQTIAVHTRSPWRTCRELGGRASLLALLVIAGSFISTLALPVFLALVAASSAHPQILEALFPVPIYHLGLASFILGNGALLMLGVAAAVVHRDYDLAKYALLFPLYWLLMSVAGYRALVELVMRPHHWHKTPHGQHTYEERQPVTGSTGAPRAQPAFQAD